MITKNTIKQIDKLQTDKLKALALLKHLKKWIELDFEYIVQLKRKRFKSYNIIINVEEVSMWIDYGDDEYIPVLSFGRGESFIKAIEEVLYFQNELFDYEMSNNITDPPQMYDGEVIREMHSPSLK